MDWHRFLHHQLIYLANGALAVLYFLWAHGPLLLSLLCAAAVALVYDRQTRQLVGDRIHRYERGRQTQASRRPYWETTTAGLLWSLASLLSAPPIPLIGALMWAALLVALRAIPQEREGLLFRQKVMIDVYALLALAMRGVFSYSPDLSQLAALMGGGSDAAGLFSTLRSSLMPYAALVIWVMYPLGYFGVIIQRFAVQRGSLLKPGGTPEQAIHDLRTRGEGWHR